MSSASGKLARVAREIEAVKDLQETVLNLNYCNLEEIPKELLCSEYCRRKLQKLYLKRNCIGTLVCCSQFCVGRCSLFILYKCQLVSTSPTHFFAPEC